MELSNAARPLLNACYKTQALPPTSGEAGRLTGTTRTDAVATGRHESHEICVKQGGKVLPSSIIGPFDIDDPRGIAPQAAI